MKPGGPDLTQHKLCIIDDRGSQYIAEGYTRDLKELGVQLSVGSVGDSYDNALAESVNGAYKCELVKDRLFDSVTGLELETAGWVAWWNQVRLHQGLGYRSPQEVVVDDTLSSIIIIGTKPRTYQPAFFNTGG